MKDLSVLQLFSYAVFLTTTILCSSPATSAAGLSMRADLTHVDSGRGFTKRELLNRMVARSRARVASLHQQRGRGRRSGYPATVPAAPAVSEFNIHFAIGTPRPQRVTLTLDTGSDLVWTQCGPCPVCFDQEPTPLFNTSASSTIRDVPCSDPICDESSIAACYIPSRLCFYLDWYGDNSTTAGIIFRDTFVFKAPDGKGGTVVVPGLAFGCGYVNTGTYENNESGIAGFGRGRQSLPSQLKVGRFSYCLTSYDDSTKNRISPVFLGTRDDLRAHATGPIRFTPFVKNDPPANPTYYYLPFKGITVGKTRLPIDESVFALRKDGSGGTIIDSGTAITTFPQAVYDELQRAFVEQVRLPVYHNATEFGDRLCFSLPQGAEAPVPPKLVFHLTGVDMDFPPENYMLPVDAGVMCLMVDGSEGGDMTVIGNYQQQNMHIVYDLQSNKLLFVPAKCDKM